MSSETAATVEPAAAAYPGEIPAATAASLTGASAGQSQLRRNLRRFLIGNKLNLVGLIIVILFFVLAIFGQVFAPYSPYALESTGS
jgi:ABC-type dipeptide/oligopeptide/nickel transport system permease subunit